MVHQINFEADCFDIANVDGVVTVTLDTQTALTAANATSFTAADGGTVDATYGAPEAGVLANNVTRIAELVTVVGNLRTRVNELEAVLVAVKLLP